MFSGRRLLSSNQVEKNYRAKAKTLNIPVRTITLIICRYKVNRTTTNRSHSGVPSKISYALRLMMRHFREKPAVSQRVAGSESSTVNSNTENNKQQTTPQSLPTAQCKAPLLKNNNNKIKKKQKKNHSVLQITFFHCDYFSILISS